MRHEGPPLEQLAAPARRVPAGFPRRGRRGGRRRAFLPAVVGRPAARPRRGPPGPAPARDLPAAAGEARRPKLRNQARLVLVACWLLHDPWFLRQRRLAGRCGSFLERGLAALAAPRAGRAVRRRPGPARGTGPRRARRARSAAAGGDRAAGPRPAHHARQRRARTRCSQKTRAAEERARRQVREAMASKAAQEAAASYGRE